MIFIVTGKQGEGKTSWVIELARLLQKEFIQVGGICSKGSWKDGLRDHFYVMDLENDHSSLLCNRVNTGHDLPFHHFFFKPEGLAFGRYALGKTDVTHPDVLIVDEVGGFELGNQGWSPFLDTMQNSTVGIMVMVVRESLVEKVVTRWKIANYQVFGISGWSPVHLVSLIQRELKMGSLEKVMPITGIILAGGKSSRFGMDKARIRFRNKLLIERAIERFSSLCSHILISANTDLYHELGYPVIHDAVKDRGPMMGIYSCLKSSSTPVNLVTSVDTPLVPSGLYRELIRIKGDAQVIVPDHGQERYEPVIGLYTQDVLEAMEMLFAGKNFTLPDLFKQIRFKGLPVGDCQPFSNPSIFANVNTFDDLAFLEHLDSLPEEIRHGEK